MILDVAWQLFLQFIKPFSNFQLGLMIGSVCLIWTATLSSVMDLIFLSQNSFKISKVKIVRKIMLTRENLLGSLACLYSYLSYLGGEKTQAIAACVLTYAYGQVYHRSTQDLNDYVFDEDQSKLVSGQPAQVLETQEGKLETTTIWESGESYRQPSIFVDDERIQILWARRELEKDQNDLAIAQNAVIEKAEALAFKEIELEKTMDTFAQNAADEKMRSDLIESKIKAIDEIRMGMNEVEIRLREKLIADRKIIELGVARETRKNEPKLKSETKPKAKPKAKAKVKPKAKAKLKAIPKPKVKVARKKKVIKLSTARKAR